MCPQKKGLDANNLLFFYFKTYFSFFFKKKMFKSLLKSEVGLFDVRMKERNTHILFNEK
jgi:hypothetical protein